MVTIELIGFLGNKNLDFNSNTFLCTIEFFMKILAKCLYVYNIIYQTRNKKES